MFVYNFSYLCKIFSGDVHYSTKIGNIIKTITITQYLDCCKIRPTLALSFVRVTVVAITRMLSRIRTIARIVRSHSPFPIHTVYLRSCSPIRDLSYILLI